MMSRELDCGASFSVWVRVVPSFVMESWPACATPTSATLPASYLPRVPGSVLAPPQVDALVPSTVTEDTQGSALTCPELGW